MRVLPKLARWSAGAFALALIPYLSAAYVIAPGYWRHYEHQPGLEAKSMMTNTALGLPGDALNAGLEGERDDIICAMLAAGWRPADPITFRSSFKIAGSVLIRRAYLTAPVSDLYWEGRKQDLAFEKPSGVSPSHRHHVRFWLALDQGELGRPVWLGGATYDRSVGVSHYTGELTHHIAADIELRTRQIDERPHGVWPRFGGLSGRRDRADAAGAQRRRRPLFYRRRGKDRASTTRLPSLDRTRQNPAAGAGAASKNRILHRDRQDSSHPFLAYAAHLAQANSSFTLFAVFPANTSSDNGAHVAFSTSNALCCSPSGPSWKLPNALWMTIGCPVMLPCVISTVAVAYFGDAFLSPEKVEVK